MLTRSMRKRAQEHDAQQQQQQRQKIDAVVQESSEQRTKRPKNDTCITPSIDKSRKLSQTKGNPKSPDTSGDDPKVKTPVKRVVTRKKRQKSRSELKKKAPSPSFSAAMRPRKQEQGTFYLKDLQIICATSEAQRPSRYVECVNHFKEDIFGLGGENLNMGFPGLCGIYLVPIWTTERQTANMTGFELVVSSVEDPSRQNLYVGGVPGMFVYLVPTFDPSIEERIIGLQLFRSRKFNPPSFGWSNTTQNINEGRGGDHLCLQWDLGTEQDIPGHRFRFRFWRRR